MKATAAFAFLFLSIVAWGQSGPGPQNISFLPKRYYVGDRVELRLQLTVPPGKSLTAPQPPRGGVWLDIIEIKCTPIRDGLWVVQIIFTSYRPGQHLLPAIDLGAIKIADLRAETRSILVDKNFDKLAGPKGQLTVPGTGVKVVLAIIFIFGSLPLFSC